MIPVQRLPQKNRFKNLIQFLYLAVEPKNACQQ